MIDLKKTALNYKNMVKNKLRTAKYYQLLFKHNLVIDKDNKEVLPFGNYIDLDKFQKLTKVYE